VNDHRRLVIVRGAAGAPHRGAVIFVPHVTELDATAARLQGHGVKVL
jgi:hypothetical protein